MTNSSIVLRHSYQESVFDIDRLNFIALFKKPTCLNCVIKGLLPGAMALNSE